MVEGNPTVTRLKKLSLQISKLEYIILVGKFGWETQMK